jgi:hypothetical protein
VIASYHQRYLTGLKSLQNQFGFFRASLSDLFQILRVLRAFLFLFRNGDRNVTGIFDVMTDLLETRLEPGHSDSGGSHVDSAARLSKIERDSDYTDFAGHQAQ